MHEIIIIIKWNRDVAELRRKRKKNVKRPRQLNIRKKNSFPLTMNEMKLLFMMYLHIYSSLEFCTQLRSVIKNAKKNI
jgi:hypothetical protein